MRTGLRLREGLRAGLRLREGLLRTGLLQFVQFVLQAELWLQPPRPAAGPPALPEVLLRRLLELQYLLELRWLQ